MKTIIILIAILMSSCIEKIDFKDVKADFYTSKPLIENESVQFYNISKFADQYTWDFGDGSISNKMHPEHIYVESGHYNVVLIAKNAKRSDILSMEILVFDWSE